eukprot:3084192-Prorocentrum_lima.AAC.1
MPLQTRAVMNNRMTIGALRRDSKPRHSVLNPMCQAQVSSKGSLGQKGAQTNSARVQSQTRHSQSPDILDSGIAGR